jgi:hypothetical protein
MLNYLVCHPEFISGSFCYYIQSYGISIKQNLS